MEGFTPPPSCFGCSPFACDKPCYESEEEKAGREIHSDSAQNDEKLGLKGVWNVVGAKFDEPNWSPDNHLDTIWGGLVAKLAQVGAQVWTKMTPK